MFRYFCVDKCYISNLCNSFKNKFKTGQNLTDTLSSSLLLIGYLVLIKKIIIIKQGGGKTRKR